MATLAEVKARTLRELGVLAIGQDAEGQDVERVSEAYEALHAEMNADKIAPWSVSGDVPDWAEQAVVVLLAHRLSRTYRLPADRRQSLYFDAVAPNNPDSAERRLRKLVQRSDPGQPIENLYY